MTDNLDARLGAMLAGPLPSPDPGFTERVIALAAHELRYRRARRRALAQFVREALALGVVLAGFVFLARAGPAAGIGDAVPLGGSAAIGVAMLVLWGLVTAREASPAGR